MSDYEIAIAQLESWIENKASVIVGFENGFAVNFNEAGVLERFEQFFVFKNSTASIMFDLQNAVPDARFEDNCYQVRLRYNCGLLSICESKRRESHEDT